MSLVSSPSNAQTVSATPAATSATSAPFTYFKVKELCPDLWEDTVVDLCRRLLHDPNDFQSAVDGARQKQLRVLQRKTVEGYRAFLDARYLSYGQQKLLGQQATAMGISMEEVIDKLNNESAEHNKMLDAKEQEENDGSRTPQSATLGYATNGHYTDAGNELEDAEHVAATKQLQEAPPERVSPMKRRRKPTLDS